MTKSTYGRYSKEFRQEAVKLVIETGISITEAAKQLSLPKTTLEHWIKAFRGGKLNDIGWTQRPLTEVELELEKVKRELAWVKQERDILKKAAAYFAKESLTGTR